MAKNSFNENKGDRYIGDMNDSYILVTAPYQAEAGAEAFRKYAQEKGRHDLSVYVVFQNIDRINVNIPADMVENVKADIEKHRLGPVTSLYSTTRMGQLELIQPKRKQPVKKPKRGR